MNTNQKNTFIQVLLTIIAMLILGMGIYYVYKDEETVPPVVAPPENNLPVITSRTPSSGPIGTIVELKGSNLAGFEGDLDAIIENAQGKTGFLPGIGSVPREDHTIRVKIESQVCTKGNSYSGLPCEEYLEITPGEYKLYTSPWGKMSNKVDFTVTASEEQMSLTLYIQDKVAAQTRDCSTTKKAIYQVPKTTAVADASLKILFEEELTQYGVYKSVTITNSVAKVMLASDNTPEGYPIGSLTSCQVGHLLAVLDDTLKQYPTIKSVELWASNGKIEF